MSLKGSFNATPNRSFNLLNNNLHASPNVMTNQELGTVGIRRLCVHTIVGLLPHERVQTQDIFISIEMQIAFAQCYQDDQEDLSHSVDYATVAEDISTWIQREQFELLESIVLLGTQRILDQYQAVECCTMEVEKPAAIETATGAWVRWTRTR